MQRAQQQAVAEKFQIINILIATSMPNATLMNTGSVVVHIVDLIITSQTSPPTHNVYHISYFINAGSTITNVGQGTTTNSLNSQNYYVMTFLTERGNGASGLYSPVPASSGAFATFGNLGFLSVNFTQTGFEYESTSQLNPTPAWSVSASQACTNEIWLISFNNHGVYDAVILKWSMAQLWQFQSGGGGGTATDFYIVKGNSQPNSLQAFPTDGSVKVLHSPTGDYQNGGPSVYLYFGATTVGGTTQQSLRCATNQVYDFFILVSYTYGGQQFNQVIPFGAMVVSS